jgi:hypothetical protein
MYDVQVKDKSGKLSTVHVAGAELKTPEDAIAFIQNHCGDVEIVGARPCDSDHPFAPSAPAEAEAEK